MIEVGSARQLRSIAEKYMNDIPADEIQSCIYYVQYRHRMGKQSGRIIYNLNFIDITVKVWKEKQNDRKRISEISRKNY